MRSTSKTTVVPFRTLLPLPTAVSRPTDIQQQEARRASTKNSELKYLLARGLKRSLQQRSRSQQQEKLHQQSLKTRRLQHEDSLRMLTDKSAESRDVNESSSLCPGESLTMPVPRVSAHALVASCFPLEYPLSLALQRIKRLSSFSVHETAEELLCKLMADAFACVHTEQHMDGEKTKLAKAARDQLPRRVAAAASTGKTRAHHSLRGTMFSSPLVFSYDEEGRQPDLQQVFASTAAACTLVQLQRHYSTEAQHCRRFSSLVAFVAFDWLQQAAATSRVLAHARHYRTFRLLSKHIRVALTHATHCFIKLQATGGPRGVCKPGRGLSADLHTKEEVEARSGGRGAWTTAPEEDSKALTQSLLKLSVRSSLLVGKRAQDRFSKSFPQMQTRRCLIFVVELPLAVVLRLEAWRLQLQRFDEQQGSDPSLSIIIFPSVPS
ncbi:hypothetical protein Esti_000721 [Eimeria stiedai]